jgi:hypothetical protein
LVNILCAINTKVIREKMDVKYRIWISILEKESRIMLW